MYYPLEINFNLFYSLTRRGRSACEGAFHAISPTYRSPEQQRGGGWWHQLAPRTRRQAENSFKQTERTRIKGSHSCLSFDSRAHSVFRRISPQVGANPFLLRRFSARIVLQSIVSSRPCRVSGGWDQLFRSFVGLLSFPSRMRAWLMQ